MELMVCVDGVERRSWELRDGDDSFNARVEREVLDVAYELKESEPDAIVTILVVTTPLDALRGTGAMKVGLGY